MKGKTVLIESIKNQKMPESLEEEMRPENYPYDTIWEDEVWNSRMWLTDKDGVNYDIVVQGALYVTKDYEDSTRLEFYIP